MGHCIMSFGGWVHVHCYEKEQSRQTIVSSSSEQSTDCSMGIGADEVSLVSEDLWCEGEVGNGNPTNKEDRATRVRSCIYSDRNEQFQGYGF